jgi:hypothetical protein
MCAEFRNIRSQEEPVPVRYDPFDCGTAWAFVDGRWTLCVSELRHQFLDHSERELMVVTQLLRQKNRLHNGRSGDITARKLAVFMSECHEEEAVILQRKRDAEAKKLFTIIDGGLPPQAPPLLEASPCQADSTAPCETPEAVPEPESLESLEGYQL